MRCLYCGDCCTRMSPISNPCPEIIQVGTFSFCRIYNNRPKKCKEHVFTCAYCPVGIEKLGLRNVFKRDERVKEGQRLIQEIFGEKKFPLGDASHAN